VDGRTLELGGRKQRAVLAALLLRVGEIVADERLIDDLWGESPPASAAHTVEAYVSRLRRELAPHGVTLERRGGGYRLGLGAAVLDAQVFEELVSNAAAALERGEHSTAASHAAKALGMWKGPVLAGVPLHHDGRAQAERLEEQRARALEIRVDADLALGRHTEVVGELRQAVDESPHRQQLVARLMVSLYRSGRHAEALDVYERTRRALDADLGLQPSEELQRLAGQIVRQEPQLRAPARTLGPESAARERNLRVSAFAIVAAFALAAAIGAFAFVVATDAGIAGDDRPARVALIRMWNPGGPGGEDEAGWRPFVDGLIAAERRHGVDTEFVDLFPRRPPLGGNAPGSYDDVRGSLLVSKPATSTSSSGPSASRARTSGRSCPRTPGPVSCTSTSAAWRASLAVRATRRRSRRVATTLLTSRGTSAGSS
jgi:DNA-binding SARP family transcriptional activator